MKNYIAGLALFVAIPAQAGGLTLDINGLSQHSKDTYRYQGKMHKYNETNLGLGLTYGVNKYVDVSAGFFENSYYKKTVYAGVRFGSEFVFGDFVVSPGIQAGFATGYADTPVNSSSLRPIVLPNLRVAYRDVGVAVGYVPRAVSGSAIAVSVVTIQLNIKLWR